MKQNSVDSILDEDFPVFSKILGKIVYNRLYKFCHKNKIIYTSQYGFRPNHSTEHALLEFQNRIVNNLSSKCLSAGVFMDLSKAFDTIIMISY